MTANRDDSPDFICTGCGARFTVTPEELAVDRHLGPAGARCPDCREDYATWKQSARLSEKAQAGFEEAMGMRPASADYPDLPADAGLRARRMTQGSGAEPQHVLGVTPEGAPLVSQPEGDPEPVSEGQARCRHCGEVITAAGDGTWAGRAGTICIPEGQVPHAPLPGGLAGGSPA